MKIKYISIAAYAKKHGVKKQSVNRLVERIVGAKYIPSPFTQLKGFTGGHRGNWMIPHNAKYPTHDTTWIKKRWKKK
jgi:hypothetical protein